jgi:hypothetical protein
MKNFIENGEKKIVVYTLFYFGDYVLEISHESHDILLPHPPHSTFPSRIIFSTYVVVILLCTLSSKANLEVHTERLLFLFSSWAW